MSEILLEFIAPYRDKALDDTALERLIALGAMAWNVALLPESKRETSIDELASKLFMPSRINPKYWFRKLLVAGTMSGKMATSPEIVDFKDVINEMIDRKISRFNQNRRWIVSYQVNITPDDVHLSVVSTMHGITP
jgi:hypothetical protein